MLITTSQGGLESSRDENSAVLPPSGVPALPESDAELTAMLSRAAESIGLEWNPPPCPERSRLDDMLGYSQWSVLLRCNCVLRSPSTWRGGPKLPSKA
ncbi:hypothetical protein cypCar_00039582 [Cyprinus carpio]|nr:hypothetical protein cypCar_00039582 [Cyprinus carpio]